MDIRIFVISIIAAGCTCIVATACSGTVNKRTVRPPVSYTPLEIKKNCAMDHLPPKTEKVGEFKKKLSALCLDCNRHRTAPASSISSPPWRSRDSPSPIV